MKHRAAMLSLVQHPAAAQDGRRLMPGSLLSVTPSGPNNQSHMAAAGRVHPRPIGALSCGEPGKEIKLEAAQ